MTQAILAKKVNAHPVQLNRIINNKINAGDELAEKLAEETDTPYELWRRPKQGKRRRTAYMKWKKRHL